MIIGAVARIGYAQRSPSRIQQHNQRRRGLRRRPHECISTNAKYSPNEKLRELLIGYVATIRTGGNPTEYLKVQSESITKEKARES